MVLCLSELTFAEIEAEMDASLQYPDPQDLGDELRRLPTWFAEGTNRQIELRDGLSLAIDHYRLHSPLKGTYSEEQSPILLHCHLSGDHQDTRTAIGNLEYCLYGAGVSPQDVRTCSGQNLILEIELQLEPETLLSFMGLNGELPAAYQPLIAAPGQPQFVQTGLLAPTMQRLLWHIVNCPYSGITKRMYLESKAIELISLVLEDVQCRSQGQPQGIALKPEEIDRIHYARKLLLKNIEQPPTLRELARQVGTNENALKRGFRACFGKPVFAYLLEYRMAQAQQLLASGEYPVGEVMQKVGFRSRKYFAEVFRRKFGLTPRECRQAGPKKFL
jgi:AraC-like DNA-binding protein